MGVEFLNGKVIVEDGGAEGGLLYVLDVLPEKKLRHLPIAATHWRPALDQDVPLRQRAAQSDSRQLLIHEEFVKIVLVVPDGVFPGSHL